MHCLQHAGRVDLRTDHAGKQARCLQGDTLVESAAAGFVTRLDYW
jgi:hypothetical protein